MKEFNLEGSVFLITGATGLIGRAVIKYLMTNFENVTVYALVRNQERAEKIFSEYHGEKLKFIVSDAESLKPAPLNIDYIIHGASNTSSRAFVEQPVEIIKTAVYGTASVLEFARVNPVKSFVFLSTMEVYGTPETDDKIYETQNSNINVLSVRSCYPESKRMCENLCVSCFSEYAVPVKILRLTQTFGEGVPYDDGRVFAEFARCAIENRDIVLKTKGETKRCYLALSDAVSAILTVMLFGENGSAYNAANESTYCSIREMAELVADKCTGGKIKVRTEINEDVSKFGYAPTLKMNLSTEKLQSLGWKPEIGLAETFSIMINDMKKRK